MELIEIGLKDADRIAPLAAAFRVHMIEIRKPYRDEKLTAKIHVEKEAFDY